MNRDKAEKHIEKIVDEFLKSIDFETHSWTVKDLEKNFIFWIQEGRIYY